MFKGEAKFNFGEFLFWNSSWPFWRCKPNWQILLQNKMAESEVIASWKMKLPISRDKEEEEKGGFSFLSVIL